MVAIDSTEKKSIINGLYEYYQQVTRSADNSSLLVRIVGLYQYQSIHKKWFMLVHIDNWADDGTTEECAKKIFSTLKVFWDVQTGDKIVPSDHKIFGAPPEEDITTRKKPPPFVQSAVSRLLLEIHSGSFNPHIIFPLTSADVSWLESNKRIIEQRLLNIEDIADARVIAGLLMAYFEELPTPLVPLDIYLLMLEAQAIEDQNWRICSLHSILIQLDPSSFILLQYMTEALAKIGIIKNSFGHLCECFGHVLLQPQIRDDEEERVRRLVLEPQKSKRRSMRGLQFRNKNNSHRKQAANLLSSLIRYREHIFVIKDENMKFQDNSGNKRVLSSATIPKIIEKLTDPYYEDPDFPHVLLIYHHYFMQTEELLEAVLKIFTLQEENITLCVLKRRQRALHVLKTWVQSHVASSTFWTEPLVARVTQFFRQTQFSISEKKHSKILEVVLENLLQKEKEPEELPKSLPLEKQKEIERNIQSGAVTPKQCAQELTLLDYSKFKRITAKECLHQRFLDKTKAPYFWEVVEQTNKVDLWTQTMVLSQPDLTQRAAVIGRFIELASELVACGNLSSSFAIYLALSSSPIARLEASWDEIPKRTLRHMDNLQKLFETSRNYDHYREAINKAVVPFLGIISKDLVAIEESNLNTLFHNQQNLTKGRLLYKQLHAITTFQNQTYFPSKEDLFVFFAHLDNFFTSDKLYELSLQYEPKNMYN